VQFMPAGRGYRCISRAAARRCHPAPVIARRPHGAGALCAEWAVSHVYSGARDATSMLRVAVAHCIRRTPRPTGRARRRRARLQDDLGRARPDSHVTSVFIVQSEPAVQPHAQLPQRQPSEARTARGEGPRG